MQVQGLMFMLLMLVIFPLVMLSSNHSVFFIVVAVVLFVSCLNGIRRALFTVYDEGEDEDEDFVEELEDTVNIDVKKFGTGTKVVKDLIIILFFVYCSFFLPFLWMKVLLSLIILYWLHNILENLSEKGQAPAPFQGSKVKLGFELAVSVAMMLAIVLSAYHKFRM